MLYITYEAVREGVPRTEVCDAKVWDKLDGTKEVMSNNCKFVVESVDDKDDDKAEAEDGAEDGAEAEGKEKLQLMGGFKRLDHHSEEARSAAVEYAREALGMVGLYKLNPVDP
jgi:hypothetical protein